MAKKAQSKNKKPLYVEPVSYITPEMLKILEGDEKKSTSKKKTSKK